jgi:hypothetical protein
MYQVLWLQFCRYAALGTGIAYGWYRYSQLKAIHVEVRDYEHRQQIDEEHKQHKIKGWKARGKSIFFVLTKPIFVRYFFT